MKIFSFFITDRSSQWKTTWVQHSSQMLAAPWSKTNFQVTRWPHQNRITLHSPLLSNFWPKMFWTTKCQADRGRSAKCSHALVIPGFQGSENSPLVSFRPYVMHCPSDGSTRFLVGAHLSFYFFILTSENLPGGVQLNVMSSWFSPIVFLI